MKIEIDTPIVPKFVADWIEQLYGQGFNSDDLLEAMFSRNYEVAELKIFRWFIDDKERAVIAILYGYEEAINEQHLADKIYKDLKTEIVEIEIKKTFGEEFNYDSYL